MAEQITSKVTAARLDTMYDNFVKITDWIIKGKQSVHTMPPKFAAVFEAAELVQAQRETLQTQNTIISGLQERIIKQEQRITSLEAALQSVNQVLAQLAEQAQQPETPTPAEPEPQEAQPPSPQAPEGDELTALDAIINEIENANKSEAAEQSETQQAAEVPKPDPVQVSAAAVGAGNIDPASYAALDDEISRLLAG